MFREIHISEFYTGDIIGLECHKDKLRQAENGEMPYQIPLHGVFRVNIFLQLLFLLNLGDYEAGPGRMPA